MKTLRPMLVSLTAVLSIASAALAQKDSAAVESKNGLVVSVSAPASDIGAAILAKGGNAVDAAVATAFALAVTHPTAGNIGGGGFMIIRPPNGTATTFDYRERAPLKSTPTMYLDATGKIDRQLTARDTWRPAFPAPFADSTRAPEVRQAALARRRDAGRRPRRERFAVAGARAVAQPPGRTDQRTPGSPCASHLGGAYGKPGGGEWAEGDATRLPDLGRALRAIATKGRTPSTPAGSPTRSPRRWRATAV